jgi:ubiquitin-like-conjugating enzyme ATG10
MTLVRRFDVMWSSPLTQDKDCTDGSPLGLEEIMNTSLLRHHALPETQATSFALFQQDALFPLLSQGDHPTLGLPSWFIHPCGTACAMSELIGEKMAEGVAEVGSQEWLLVWLETWFMMLGNMVKL